MCHIKRIIFLIIFMLLDSAYIYPYKNFISEVSPRNSFEQEELADGDLVFRTGRDMMTRLVLSQGESSRFSHVGIIVKQGKKTYVVHALPHDNLSQGGVQIEPLVLFASTENAAEIGFYRIKNIDLMSQQKIRIYALQQLGKPFDNAFRFSDDTEFYCTELVLKALAAGGIDLSKSIMSIEVFMLSEPVFPPDYLRRSSILKLLTPKPPLKSAFQLSRERF